MFYRWRKIWRSFNEYAEAHTEPMFPQIHINLPEEKVMTKTYECPECGDLISARPPQHGDGCKTLHPNSGSVTVDLQKVLKERGNKYGDHKEMYTLVWKLWYSLLKSKEFWKLEPWRKVEVMMIQFKVGRGVNSPEVQDHWIDIGGYAQLAGDNDPSKHGTKKSLPTTHKGDDNA